MAYSNWGAFVYCNRKRRTDKEDVGVFDTDEADVPAGWRIFVNIGKNNATGNDDWADHSHHAVLGDGEVRLCGYKNSPELWRIKNGARERVDLSPFLVPASEDEDDAEYAGAVDGYEFRAKQFDGNMLRLWLKEPDGTEWESTCGFEYGAGHMD